MSRLFILLFLLFPVVESFCQIIYTSDLNELIATAERFELSQMQHRGTRRYWSSICHKIDSARVVCNYNTKNLQNTDTIVVLARYYQTNSANPSYIECVLRGSAPPCVGFDVQWGACETMVQDYSYSLVNDLFVTYLRLNKNGLKSFIDASMSKKRRRTHIGGCPLAKLYIFLKQDNGGYFYNAYSGCQCLVVDRFAELDYEFFLWEVNNKRDIDEKTAKEIIANY